MTASRFEAILTGRCDSAPGRWRRSQGDRPQLAPGRLASAPSLT